MRVEGTKENSIYGARLIISVLWIARMLSGIQADTFRLSDPAVLQSLIDNTGPIIVTSELLLVMSIIFVVPIFMSVLTLIMKYPVFRWTNRILGIFFFLFDLVFLVLALSIWDSTGYEIIWSIAYLAFTTLIVWYAWKLPKQIQH